VTDRLRAAIVVQRYGVDVNGGSEYLARIVAEALRDDVDVTVLTTCALDYVSWENHFPPGPTTIHDVRVIRFPVAEPRTSYFDELTPRAYAAPADLKLGREWVRAQGPRTPGLLEHLASVEYDVVLFFTYLYATSVEGIPIVADHAVLVPTAHDEPPLKLHVFDEIFREVKLLLFSTPEEQWLVEWRFGVEKARCRQVAIGIEHVQDGDADRFRRKTGIAAPFALCMGRLDASKGVPQLIENHDHYRSEHPGGLDLVLTGRGRLELDDSGWLHCLGYVDEELKHDAVAAAAVVVLPSPYESLSLAQLEAWEHGRPTLANAESGVLVGQSRRSGGGLWYADRQEYAVMLNALAGMRPVAEAIGRQGSRFTGGRYRWEQAKGAWLAALEDAAR
jgi:glycosyltransferase involved in cell wall biosynthesis